MRRTHNIQFRMDYRRGCFTILVSEMQQRAEIGDVITDIIAVVKGGAK